MATSLTRIRLPNSVHIQAQDLAKAQNQSLSAIVRHAIDPYLRGDKQFEFVPDDPIKQTSVLIDSNDVDLFKELAQNANTSVYEAFRIAINQYLSEKRHQSDT